MRRAAVVLAALVIAGCAAVRPTATPEPRGREGLERAAAEARAGRPRAARKAYAQVLEGDPTGPVAEDALRGLALLYVDADSPLRNYPAALAAFDRLLAANPHGQYAEEARAWRAALRELIRHEREATRLRADIERLRELDVQMEGKR